MSGVSGILEKQTFWNTDRYDNKEISKFYEIKKHGKKKQYNERVMKIEHDSFTSFVTAAG